MCYMVYIGSKTAINKEEWQDRLMAVWNLKPEDERIRTYFSCDNVYFLSSSTVCSCEFRITVERSLGFGVPEAWLPESEESIKGTRQIYALIKTLAVKGEPIELLCIWADHIGKPVESEDIRIDSIAEDQFRMFENRMFRISSA